MVRFGKAARDKEWGFTEVSLPRFHSGDSTGVLVCHGFGCTPSTMSCLYSTAVDLGHTADMPLLAGHAKTFGELEKAGFADWQKDVDAAYARLADAGCERIVLCGLSLGALLMADLAARRADDSRIAGVFLICPPIRMKSYLNFCAAIAPLIPYVQTADGFAHPGNELYYGMATRKLNDIKAAAGAALAGADRINAPVTLVEAGEDSRVDPKSYDMLEARLADHRRILIPGAPHGIPYSRYSGELCRIFEEFLKGSD